MPKAANSRDGRKRWRTRARRRDEVETEQRVGPWPLGVSGHGQTLFIPSLPARMVQALGPQAPQHGAPTGTAPRPSHPGRGRKGEDHSADLAENTMFCPGYQQGSWHQAHCLATHSP